VLVVVSGRDELAENNGVEERLTDGEGMEEEDGRAALLVEEIVVLNEDGFVETLVEGDRLAVTGGGEEEGDALAGGDGVMEGDTLVKAVELVEGDGVVEGDALAEGDGVVEGDRLAEGDGVVGGDALAEGDGVMEGDTLVKAVGLVEGDGLNVTLVEGVDVVVGDGVAELLEGGLCSMEILDGLLIVMVPSHSVFPVAAVQLGLTGILLLFNYIWVLIRVQKQATRKEGYVDSHI